MKKYLEIARYVSVFISLVLLGMSFGAIPAVLGVVVGLYIGAIMLSAYTVKRLTIAEYVESKGEKSMLKNITNGLSLVVFLVFLFGQLVFSWYYVLFFIISIASILMGNPKLISDIRVLDAKDAKSN